MPDWVPVLLAAEEWGVPPWTIEEQVTAEWWERWLMLRNERGLANKPKDKPGSG